MASGTSRHQQPAQKSPKLIVKGRDNNKHNHLDNTLLINSNMSTNKSVTAVKLVLLGEAAVGKSSLVLRFVSNDFQENKGKNAEMIELDQYH